jgi:hypothetical protein
VATIEVNLMKNLILMCVVLTTISSVVYASCLNQTDIDAINNISNSTNTSNVTLVSLFERLCTLNNSLINLTNTTNITSITINNTINQLNMTIANLTNTTNNTITSFNNTLNDFNSTLVNYTNETINETISNFTDVLNKSFDNRTTQMINDIWTIRGLPLTNQSNSISNDINNLYGNLSTISANVTATSFDINNKLLTLGNSLSLQVSNAVFPLWILMILLGAVSIYLFYLKPKYPKISLSTISLKGHRILPQQLGDESEIEHKDMREDIKTMRDFLSSHEEFSPTTRALAYTAYNDGELDSTDDALKFMRLTEPKVIIPKSPPKKIIKKPVKQDKPIEDTPTE